MRWDGCRLDSLETSRVQREKGQERRLDTDPVTTVLDTALETMLETLRRQRTATAAVAASRRGIRRLQLHRDELIRDTASTGKGRVRANRGLGRCRIKVDTVRGIVGTGPVRFGLNQSCDRGYCVCVREVYRLPSPSSNKRQPLGSERPRVLIR